MFDLLNSISSSTANPLVGMIKRFLPMAVEKLQGKIAEEEKKYGGSLLYVIYNEMVAGSLTTFICIYGFKPGAKAELTAKLNLKDYVGNDELLASVIQQAEGAMDNFGPFAALLKPHLSNINSEVLGSFLENVTGYLEQQSVMHNGKASLHLQVVKGKPVIQVLKHESNTVAGKSQQVEIMTLEKFGTKLLDQFC